VKRTVKKMLGRYGRHFIQTLLGGSGEIIGLSDLSEQERAILSKAAPYTMTSPARMASLVESVKFIVKNKIEGDIVECGVWRGGSMMIIASTLLALGDTSRSLFLYDTYTGMSEPTELDVDYAGSAATKLLANTTKGEGVWCEASIQDVRKNVLYTGYPPEKIHFIEGKVEETIPQIAPSKIALLRLDTDWYESTKHELTHLYPLLIAGGILIIDDYGHWQGARKAVDEYFENSPIFLHRIDNTGRLAVKPLS
jgi:O-methyltransferase